MDWASITFGAFMALVGAFAASSLVLAYIMRRAFLLWMVARVLAIGLLVLTFEPVAGAIFDSPERWLRTRLAATDLTLAFVGPILATYMDRRIKLDGTRKLLWAMLPIGTALALAFAFLPGATRYDWFHDLVIALLLGMLIVGLVNGVRAGSRAAAFQAAAWAPAICVALVGLYCELVLLLPLPNYAPWMLAALSIEFVITAGGIGDSFVSVSRERDQARRDVHAALKETATDPLTGIANRRGLESKFSQADAPTPSGFALIDCDHFKRINDELGHNMGDRVLVAVAQGLNVDDAFVARLGGEEFILLLYGDDWEDRAEMARAGIDHAVHAQVPGLPFPVTASAGLTQMQGGDTLAKAMKRADKALYAAKEAGRDCSVTFEDESPRARLRATA